MNEKNLFDEVSNTFWISRKFQKYPIVNSSSELEKKSNEIFLTPIEILNDFLKEKFNNMGIVELMLLYTEKHFGEAFCLPVFAPMVKCLFCSTNQPDFLSRTLENYQSVIRCGKPALNLHTDDTYIFTLIQAKFSLKENKNKFYFGYHHETDNFRFFIKSSIQGDLTLLYEEL